MSYEEINLVRKGVNTRSSGVIYRAFKEYICFPTYEDFLKGEKKDYSEEQFVFLGNVISKSTEPAIVIKEIKEAINFLNDQGFTQYSQKDFFRFFSTYCEEEDKKYAKKAISSGYVKLDDYFNNAKLFWKIKKYFYDKSGLFWLWSDKDYKWEIIDYVDLMLAFGAEFNLHSATIPARIKNNYIEAFKKVGRMYTPQDAPTSWVQFGDRTYDIFSGESLIATPNYFVCNPISWIPFESEETPKLDQLFESWVGEKYKPLLYEIIAYCCLCDYPIHRIFCSVGSGRNGKSQYMKIVSKFLGMANICSADLDRLASPQQRFEKSKLYKKLACLLGETNFGTIHNTSTLKQLTSGGEPIDFEFKGKDPFTGTNYATILISSNSLPTSLDTSEGFYRRWIIIPFLNEFKEGRDIIKEIPDLEFNNLAKKVLRILPKLLERGSFTAEGSVEEKKRMYIMNSNPLPFFIENFCVTSPQVYCRRSELFNAYTQYLIKSKKRKVSLKEFRSALVEEGYEDHRTFKDNIRDVYVEHIRLKDHWRSSLSNLSLKSTLFLLGKKHTKKESGILLDEGDNRDNQQLTLS